MTVPILTSLDGPTLTVTLDRPDKLNALNAAVIDALHAVCDRVVADRSIRSVIITGSGGRAFCAGADLDELAGLDPQAASAALRRGQQLMSRLGALRVPTVAAVNGYALGGGFEMALGCTMTIASTNASFGLPETGLGLIPGYGGTQRLARLVGRQRAAYLITTGRRWDAAEADRHGLLALPPVPPDELLPLARDLAADIAGKGPFATATALGLIAGTELGVEEGLVHETSAATLMTTTAEAHEGIAAFRERRAPRFGETPS